MVINLKLNVLQNIWKIGALIKTIYSFLCTTKNFDPIFFC